MSNNAAATEEQQGTTAQRGIDLLIIVSTADSGKVLMPLAGACRRRGLRWSCFFTNDGVRVLDEPELMRALSCAEESIACEHSWERLAGNTICPITLGSQTGNSALVGRASKIIGL
jgi:hypothetical protein